MQIGAGDAPFRSLWSITISKGSFGWLDKDNNPGIKCGIILSCIWLWVLISPTGLVPSQPTGPCTLPEPQAKPLGYSV